MWQNQSACQSPCLTVFGMLVFVSGVLYAQPTNDDCDEPNQGSEFPIAQVKPNLPRQVQRIQAMDLQAVGIPLLMMFGFSFTAKATGVNIVINGKTLVLVCATHKLPLYIWVCGGQIQELEYQSDTTGSRGVALIENGLVVGATYYIRVVGVRMLPALFNFALPILIHR